MFRSDDRTGSKGLLLNYEYLRLCTQQNGKTQDSSMLVMSGKPWISLAKI